MSNLTPTDEQEAILTAVRSKLASLMIRSYAGCTKTTTLQLIAEELQSQKETRNKAIALAFNVDVKEKMEQVFPAGLPIRTLNGHGHKALMSITGKSLKLDERKLGKIVSEVLKREKVNHPLAWGQVRELVSEAMKAGILPKAFPQKPLLPDEDANWLSLISPPFPSNYIIDLARLVLTESIKMVFKDGIISYDDQLYIPVLFRAPFPKYPFLLLDETQDFSDLNLKMVERSLGPDSLIYAVGDPKQAIYQFRGADGKSMDRLRALRAQWLDLPLTLTFRCPKAIVQRQQAHAPGFRSALTNKLGKIITFKAWSFEDVDSWVGQCLLPDGSEPSLAVLCRNNAPLLALGMKLLRKQIRVKFLGHDSLGKGLITLTKTIFKGLEDLGQAGTIAKIISWKESEIAKARFNQDFDSLEKIEDKADCLLAVMSSGAQDAQDLIWQIENLFSPTESAVTFSTGHKAKGLEWDIVLHLDHWRLKPGKKQLSEQDENLLYVIETRTKDLLIEADFRDFIP